MPLNKEALIKRANTLYIYIYIYIYIEREREGRGREKERESEREADRLTEEDRWIDKAMENVDSYKILYL